MGVGQHEDPDKTGRSGRFQQGEINDASGNLTAFLILLQLIGQNHLHKKMFITPNYILSLNDHMCNTFQNILRVHVW